MLRRLFVLFLVCMVIGFGVNVLIAWAIASWGALDAGASGHTRIEERADLVAWLEARGDDLAWRPEWVTTASGTGLQVDLMMMQGPGIGMPLNGRPMMTPSVDAKRLQAGWPWLSMEGAVLGNTLEGGAVATDAVALANDAIMPMGVGGANDRLVPMRPRPGGTIGNTLFFGVAAFVVLAGSMLWRRRRRMARGCCPECAYPVGASVNCAECGTPVPAAARASTPRDAAPTA